MLRTFLSRRRLEDARVDAFLDAIRLSETYTLDPTWQLQRVDDAAPLEDATVALPMSLVTLLVIP
jgi:hypothetical protein